MLSLFHQESHVFELGTYINIVFCLNIHLFIKSLPGLIYRRIEINWYLHFYCENAA
jgi:hypothetical protein